MVLNSSPTATDIQLRDYELVVVLKPDLAEEQADAAVESINRFVTSRGGSQPAVEKWGKKRLAYTIKHYNEGNYLLAKFKMKPEAGKELESNLKISESVLRHMLIRLDDGKC